VSNPPPTSDLISLGDSTGNEVEFGAFQGQSNSLPSFPFSNKGIESAFYETPSPQVTKNDSQVDLLAPAPPKEAILALYNNPLTPTGLQTQNPTTVNSTPISPNSKPSTPQFKPNYDINLTPVGAPVYPRAQLPIYNPGYVNPNYLNSIGVNPIMGNYGQPQMDYVNPTFQNQMGFSSMGVNPMMSNK